MRTSSSLAIAAAFSAAILSLSNPAAATDLKGALALCNKHGGCQVLGRPGIGVNIKYGNNEIFCPYGGGKCECLACTPPKRTGTGTGPKAPKGFGSVLSGQGGQQPAPNPQPRPVVGTRDGGIANGPVAPRDQPIPVAGGPKPVTHPVIRDHRTGSPGVVRDHRIGSVAVRQTRGGRR